MPHPRFKFRQASLSNRLTNLSTGSATAVSGYDGANRRVTQTGSLPGPARDYYYSDQWQKPEKVDMGWSGVGRGRNLTTDMTTTNTQSDTANPTAPQGKKAHQLIKLGVDVHWREHVVGKQKGSGRVSGFLGKFSWLY